MENDNGDIDDDDVEQKEFGIGDDPSAVLDQYLGAEELKELILKERRECFWQLICHKEPHRLMSSMIFNIKKHYFFFFFKYVL